MVGLTRPVQNSPTFPITVRGVHDSAIAKHALFLAASETLSYFYEGGLVLYNSGWHQSIPLELLILLPPPSVFWDYRYVPPCPVLCDTGD